MSVCLKYNKALAALALFAALGCGQNNMVPVKGTVTLDGQPIEGALVKFIPKPGAASHEATAVTDASGNFSLGTLKDGDGAWRGVYKVCVQKIMIDPADMSKIPDLPGGADPSSPKTEGASRAQVMRAMKYKKNIFPKEYMNADTTPLEKTVPTDGPVLIDIKSKR